MRKHKGEEEEGEGEGEGEGGKGGEENGGQRREKSRMK